MLGKNFIENYGLVMMAPQDFNGAATGSLWVDLSNYGHATFVFMAGESADDAAITLKEAQDTSGTGSQTLAFTKAWSSGQRLNIDTITGTFSVGETITGGTSTLTAELYKISSDHMLVRNVTGGTTWTTGETLTGGTSAATAVISGTGQDEDILVPLYTAPASTMTYASVTFKMYALEIDADQLTDGYKCIQVSIANPGGASIGGGLFILSRPAHKGMPMPSAIGTQKMVADHA